MTDEMLGKKQITCSFQQSFLAHAAAHGGTVMEQKVEKAIVSSAMIVQLQS